MMWLKAVSFFNSVQNDLGGTLSESWLALDKAFEVLHKCEFLINKPQSLMLHYIIAQ